MSSIGIKRNNKTKDFLGIVYFVIAVILGTLLINSFVFRSYSVVGISMEDTLQDGDQIIVNRLPVTWSQIKNETYVPKRGQIIVFQNPKLHKDSKDKFLVKRAIAFAGERVTIENGELKVYNQEHPEGFVPSEDWKYQPRKPTSGDVDVTVPEGSIFVAGDHRDGRNSFDSRNGLGNVPLYDVIGPVKIRLFPIHKLSIF